MRFTPCLRAASYRLTTPTTLACEDRLATAARWTRRPGAPPRRRRRAARAPPARSSSARGLQLFAGGGAAEVGRCRDRRSVAHRRFRRGRNCAAQAAGGTGEQQAVERRTMAKSAAGREFRAASGVAGCAARCRYGRVRCRTTCASFAEALAAVKRARRGFHRRPMHPLTRSSRRPRTLALELVDALGEPHPRRPPVAGRQAAHRGGGDGRSSASAARWCARPSPSCRPPAGRHAARRRHLRRRLRRRAPRLPHRARAAGHLARRDRGARTAHRHRDRGRRRWRRSAAARANLGD